ncbi:MAG TPA: ABC transporter substrate-binding protein [Candidatus Binataceae bacterium]|nr:ABC transporter substrate-binding protein [Candidatus Binataceae bacterium]
MKITCVASMIVAVMIAGAGPARASDTSNTAPAGPTASVKSIVDQAIAVFKDKAVAPADREKKLRAIAESHFDFDSMARTAVGRHWREFTPDQQKQFVPMFTAFIEDVYLSQMEQYSVEKVQQVVESSNIQFIRERIDTPDQAVVFSEVTLRNRDKALDVNYLLKRADSEWKIYDITLDAISVMANYRNQFNRVLNDGGYDKLTAIMRQKQQALGAAMAN